MLWPMRILLCLCLAIGLLPQLTLRFLSPVLTQLTAIPAPEFIATFAQLGQIGLWGIILIAVLMILGLLLTYLRKHRPTATAVTWACSFPRPTARMSYSAEGYSEFAHNHLLPQGMRPEVSKKRPSQLFPVRVRFFQHSREGLLLHFYQPIFTYLADRCVRLRWFQQGKPHFYLLYIFTSCALLMLWSILDGKGL